MGSCPPRHRRNLGTGGELERGSYDLGSRLQQPGALVASADKASLLTA